MQREKQYRSRSHSWEGKHDHKKRRHRSRSRSPHRHGNSINVSVANLPFGATRLSKHDLTTHRPMFALYLDIQKQLDIDDLDENEVKGRWKSFVGKWNRGELAEGWYDPNTLRKTVGAGSKRDHKTESNTRNHFSDDEDADYGPALPASNRRSGTSYDKVNSRREVGPSVPSVSDLRDRREQVDEDTAVARQEYIDSIHHERRLDRRVQKDRLDEIAPRAEPGTRERQLEKKREVAESNRAFAAAKDGGAETEVRDADLMGDEDSFGDLKKMKREMERKKNEREIRREEILRAKRAEREERFAGLRAREEKTVEMLKEIARARFGGDELADHG